MNIAPFKFSVENTFSSFLTFSLPIYISLTHNSKSVILLYHLTCRHSLSLPFNLSKILTELTMRTYLLPLNLLRIRRFPTQPPLPLILPSHHILPFHPLRFPHKSLAFHISKPRPSTSSTLPLWNSRGGCQPWFGNMDRLSNTFQAHFHPQHRFLPVFPRSPFIFLNLPFP